MTKKPRDSAASVARLHHVTGIAGDAQTNYNFYAQILGLRLIKKTVNFDDPGTYHLYYGDRIGSPGSALTFFPFPGAAPGRSGVGQSVLTQFSAPKNALGFWAERLRGAGVPNLRRETVFGEERLLGQDPDGAAFALVAVADDPRAGGEGLWTTPEIGADHAVRGFHGVTLALAEAAATATVLTDAFSYRLEQEEAVNVGGKPGRLVRYRGSGPGSVVDILQSPDLPQGREGAGVTHHVAFRVENKEAQAEMRERLAALGHPTTVQIDRQYFWSIYFRTPGGVLFEIATDDPGFAVDEPLETMGGKLMLPPQFEPSRARIEAALPTLQTN